MEFDVGVHLADEFLLRAADVAAAAARPVAAGDRTVTGTVWDVDRDDGEEDQSAERTYQNRTTPAVLGRGPRSDRPRLERRPRRRRWFDGEALSGPRDRTVGGVRGVGPPSEAVRRQHGTVASPVAGGDRRRGRQLRHGSLQTPPGRRRRRRRR